ncbi:hypothetical protein VTN49DRAFT_3777 [Thermomyces lanuginosus]|uniref:uncharacterized protein n=1 Tax=Thermomyces lanuginosus TaxID=5541 RepID=UPI0037447CF8
MEKQSTSQAVQSTHHLSHRVINVQFSYDMEDKVYKGAPASSNDDTTDHDNISSSTLSGRAQHEELAT